MGSNQIASKSLSDNQKTVVCIRFSQISGIINTTLNTSFFKKSAVIKNPLVTKNLPRMILIISLNNHASMFSSIFYIKKSGWINTHNRQIQRKLRSSISSRRWLIGVLTITYSEWLMPDLNFKFKCALFPRESTARVMLENKGLPKMSASCRQVH